MADCAIPRREFCRRAAEAGVAGAGVTAEINRARRYLQACLAKEPPNE